MIVELVRYLKHHQVAFRLFSYPMPEPLPEVAHPRSHAGQLVDTYVVLAGGVPAIACVSHGEQVDIAALGREIGSIVTDATADDLPAPFRGAEHVPPFGALFGVPTFLDTRVLGGVLAFRAFAGEDFVEVAIEDLTRLERPRLAAFATAGALPPHEEEARARLPA